MDMGCQLGLVISRSRVRLLVLFSLLQTPKTKNAHLAVSLFRYCVWCRHQESNSGPTDYKSKLAAHVHWENPLKTDF